jgi:hypothetical protein
LLKSFGSMITGIRLWIGSIMALGAVVRMAALSSSDPSGAIQCSQMPPKANNSSPGRVM